MDDTYLVEIRLARTRWRVKDITRFIVQKFGAERDRERHPHITLYGPFTLDNPSRDRIFLIGYLHVLHRLAQFRSLSKIGSSGMECMAAW